MEYTEIPPTGRPRPTMRGETPGGGTSIKRTGALVAPFRG